MINSKREIQMKHHVSSSVWSRRAYFDSFWFFFSSSMFFMCVCSRLYVPFTLFLKFSASILTSFRLRFMVRKTSIHMANLEKNQFKLNVIDFFSLCFCFAVVVVVNLHLSIWLNGHVHVSKMVIKSFNFSSIHIVWSIRRLNVWEYVQN